MSYYNYPQQASYDPSQYPLPPVQSPQQQQQQQPYLNQQYSPPPPLPKPSGGLIKVLNVFSSKPSYSASASIISTPPPMILTSPTQYVASPQNYNNQSQTSWENTASPFPTPLTHPENFTQQHGAGPNLGISHAVTYPFANSGLRSPSYTNVDQSAYRPYTPQPHGAPPPPPLRVFDQPPNPGPSPAPYNPASYGNLDQAPITGTATAPGQEAAAAEIEKLRKQVEELQAKLTAKTEECYMKDSEVGGLKKTMERLGGPEGLQARLTEKIEECYAKDAEVRGLKRTVERLEGMTPVTSGGDGFAMGHLQKEIETIQKREQGKDEELARIRNEAAQLRIQMGEVQGQAQEQVSAAQRAAQEQRASAEENHKFAVEKDQEVTRVRQELLDLQNAMRGQGQQLEWAKQEAESLRIAMATKTPAGSDLCQECQRAGQEIQGLKALLGQKDVELARLGSAIQAHTMSLSQKDAEIMRLHQTMLPKLAMATAPTNSPEYQNAVQQIQELQVALEQRDTEIARLQHVINTQTSGIPMNPFIGSGEIITNGHHTADTWNQHANAHHQTQGQYNYIQCQEDDDSPPDRSPAEQEWDRQKEVEGCSNEALDYLMDKFAGMENVKEQFLTVKAKIDTARRQGVDLSNERFDMVILGNPGTGKSDVGRLYSWFLRTYLFEDGSGPGWIEKSGSQLLASEKNGLTEVKEILDEMKGLSGDGKGVLMIDDVQHLVEMKEGNSTNVTVNSGIGVQIIDYLLSERERGGNINIIFAGKTSILDEHSGLTKVSCVLQLEDYGDRELHLILRNLIEERYNGQMEVEGGLAGLFMRIAVRRAGRGRNRKGFGNARAIKQLFGRIRERQWSRLNRERKDGLDPNDFFFTKEDMIGPNPSEGVHKSVAWRRLQELIGLETVKESVRSMIDMIETNYIRELQEKPPMDISLNRVFLGSPGTGKTSVAKLYGQILADLGLLSSGEVVVKNPADFLGNWLGQSENKTKSILASTIGKVLVIDEAYMLYPNSGVGQETDVYKIGVIDTLVAEVQSTPGEDRCVLLLGYEDQIKIMFQNANPGLARRFAIEDAFKFEDFTDPQLRQILELKLHQQQLQAAEPAKQVACEVLSRARMRPHFGNAGEVENCISQAKVRYQTRVSKIPPTQRPHDVVFEPQDFDPGFARGASAVMNCKKLFEDVVGCEDIAAKLEDYQRFAFNARSAGLELNDELIPMNFIFKGPPGTGKTMIARKMGKIYYDMGFLSTESVVECSATDMIGQTVGTTGPKTQKLFEKALGQVLFIDEAYRLKDDGYGSEALNEMVDILTKPTYKGRIIVILAGYEEDMNNLLKANQGLSSRFPEEIMFRNLPPPHCIEILVRDLENKKVAAPWLREPGSRPYRMMVDLIERLAVLPSWGNARDMKTLAKTMIGVVYRVERPTFVLSPDEGLDCVQRLLGERQARAGVGRDGGRR